MAAKKARDASVVPEPEPAVAELPNRGFRLRDPFDWSSGDDGAAGVTDQVIGVGDGEARSFRLVKHYGAVVRRITRPVAEAAPAASVV